MSPVDPYGLVGQVLDGQFRVDAPIGEGGFSVVYRGRHLGLDEPVAIKCLKLQAQLGSAIVETFVRRFRDESKIHYKLSQGSLHVARTIAAGTTMAPATSALVPYMVLEWLEGFTLAEQLRARRDRGERGRPIAEVIKVLDPVAEAMALAHSLGVVHRDLNPSNIFCMVLPGGALRLKVMDFGVAKIVSDHALALGPRQATLGSIRMFTPAYGAPEQFSDALGPVGAPADVYAFALLVVELLLDRTPITGEHLGEFLEKALDPVNRPTARSLGAVVGDAVEDVLRQALAVEPASRPQDIGQLWGLLKNAATRDDEAARRSVAPPGSKLTSKGTMILPEQLGLPSAPPPAMKPTGAGATQPIPRFDPPAAAPPPRNAALASTLPMVSDPARPRGVDAYGPTHPGQDEPVIARSPVASTHPEPVYDRIDVGPPGAASIPLGPRATPPVPVARRASNAPVIALVALGVVVLAVVSWAFARFVL